MGVLAEFKQAMEPGSRWRVTNHYIRRDDHPCVGTTERVVTVNNSASYEFNVGGRTRWPKASSLVRVATGFQIWGHPKSGDLFLTLEPLPVEAQIPTTNDAQRSAAPQGQLR